MCPDSEFLAEFPLFGKLERVGEESMKRLGVVGRFNASPAKDEKLLALLRNVRELIERGRKACIEGRGCSSNSNLLGGWPAYRRI